MRLQGYNIIFLIIGALLWAPGALAQLPEPKITALEPSEIAAGKRLTIRGEHFTSYTKVHFTSAETTFALPAAAGVADRVSVTISTSTLSGNYQVRVQNVDGRSSNELPLKIDGQAGGSVSEAAARTLQINSLTPTSVRAGERVVVTGSGFASFTTVHVQGEGSDVTTSAASGNGQTLAFTVPRTLPGGTHAVSVRVGSAESNTLSLSVEALPTPTPRPTASPTTSPTPGQPAQQCRFLGFFCRPVTHTYVALGDSLASGFVAFQGYVSRYHTNLERDLALGIRLNNESRTGARSGDLLAALRSDQRVRQAVQQADFITWNVGGNDWRDARDQYRRGACGGADNQECLRDTLARFREHWDGVVAEISSLKKSDQVVVRTMDLYNPFVQEDRRVSWPAPGTGAVATPRVRDVDVFRPYWEASNQHIHTTAGANNIRVAPVAAYFNGPAGDRDPEQRRLISRDEFHPNEQGHRVIADLLRQTGYNP
jgi:lysophospholipase L1-like esterase